MDEFELELKQDFLEESSDLLEAAESAFLRLEQERENPDLINEIFRLAHNLKGTSKAVGFDQLAELTHVAENLILKLKNGTFSVNDEIVTTLLVFKDKVFEMIEGLKENFEALFEIDELKSILSKLADGDFKAESELDEAQMELNDESNFVDIEPEQELSLERDDSAISAQAIESLRESGFDDETIRAMLAEEAAVSYTHLTLPTILLV